MKPVIVLVGRPNVGKSHAVQPPDARARRASSPTCPALTRDRHYGEGRSASRSCIVVDTGGFEPVAKDGIFAEMARQTRAGDRRGRRGDPRDRRARGARAAGPGDRREAAAPRRQRVWLAVNKAEGMDPETAAAEFHELGLGDPLPISAAHGDGVRGLIEAALRAVPRGAGRRRTRSRSTRASRSSAARTSASPRWSTRCSARSACIAFDQPGTTRDAIDVPFERDGRRYTLIDTAGLRKRGKVVRRRGREVLGS